MNLEQMLNIADEIVFTKTGQHLDDLQKIILQGTLQGHKYKEIAQDFHCAESTVRNTGSELWQLLSDGLGEDVNKSNFRSVIERVKNSNILNFANNVKHSFNICEKARHPQNISNSNSQNEEISNHVKPKIYYEDLSEMPELGTFFDRSCELENLKTSILQSTSRLISLTGISGIGKTTLAIKLIQDIKYEFEYVLWCSLETYSTFSQFQSHLIEFLSQSENQDLSKPLSLIKYLQKYRCLVVLDNLQNLFISQELAGKYKPKYEEYRSFFKRIETLSHQSCFLLIGWEQLREIYQIKTQNSHICTLQLTGLNITSAEQILKDYGIAEIDQYSALINRYQSHPLWLKSVANLMQELELSITDLLLDDRILLTTEIKDILQRQTDRLSEIEKQILSLLSKENQPINLIQLLEKSLIYPDVLTNTLQSLSRRYLVEKQQGFYHILPVLKEYFNSYMNL